MKIKFNNLRLFLAVCLTRGGKKGNPKTEMSQKGGYYTPKYHPPHSLCVYVCIYMRKCAICHFSDCFLKLSSSSFSVSGSMAKVKVSVSISCNVMLCFSLVFFFGFFSAVCQDNTANCSRSEKYWVLLFSWQHFCPKIN